MDKTLTYRPHQARRVRALAKVPDFQDASGGPDFTRLSQEVGISVQCVRYLLTGELPATQTFELTGGDDGTD